MPQTIGDLIKIFRASGEAAYGDYIAMLSKDVCKGQAYKLEHGKFGPEELNAHCAATGFLEKHRAHVAFVRALQDLTP